MPKASNADVRFGSLADIGVRPRHVRFTPKSGHCIAPQRMSAMCQKRTSAVSFDHLVGLGKHFGRNC